MKPERIAELRKVGVLGLYQRELDELLDLAESHERNRDLMRRHFAVPLNYDAPAALSPSPSEPKT